MLVVRHFMLGDSKYAVHSQEKVRRFKVSRPHDVRLMSAKRECRLLLAFLSHVRIHIHPPPQKTLSSSFVFLSVSIADHMLCTGHSASFMVLDDGVFLVFLTGAWVGSFTASSVADASILLILDENVRDFRSQVGTCYILILGDSMTENYANASASSSSSLNSSLQDTEDDHTIATILAQEENLKYDGKLGKRLSHLDSIPYCGNLYFDLCGAGS
ncbi:unnamed protein product [Ilex paraguariensis]|uniref:Uncharacterized protein n=1 Tax=Ilex paraguariensis TaxID=185542 RepID=A0ABC8TGF9_9AQUA